MSDSRVKKNRLHIAVVDDDESVRKALSRLLRSAGMTVKTFSGGAELLQSLADYKPDCVVLDINMPVVTGFDVLARLSEAKAPFPVMVISGRDSTNIEERALEAGAVAFLRKPINDQALLSAIAASSAFFGE